MSKRLHASLRAVNKGRNLRPRSSQVPAPPPESSPSTAPSADLRAKETVREPSPVQAALAAFTGDVSEAPDERETTRSSSVDDERAAAEAKVAQARAEQEAEVEQVKAEEARLAQAKAEQAKAEQVKAEQTRLAQAKAEQAKAEQVKAEQARLAQAKAEQAKAEQAKAASKKGEPAKAEPGKAKQSGAKQEVSRVDPKKGPPAKADDRGPPSKKGEPAGEKNVRKPEAARRPGHDEDVDTSSISAEFFRKDQDSVPPIEEHDEVEAVPHIILSPTTLARRARLRRIVAGVVAFAGVVSIAVIGRVASGKRHVEMPPLAEVKRDSSEPKQAAEPKPPAADEKRDEKKGDAPKADDAKPAESAKADDAKPADAKPADAKPEDAKKDDAKPADAKPGDAKASDAKADDAKKDDAKKDDKPALSAADVKALKKETESLLNRGKNKDAIEKARELIAADPSDASGYLFMGAALQETGKWKDGIESYCECVRNATKGPINECRAMGGHK